MGDLIIALFITLVPAGLLVKLVDDLFPGYWERFDDGTGYEK